MKMDELEGFKTNINLTQYAAGQGYVLDRRESSRNSAVMRHPNGDKIIIARGHDGHWIYFSVRDNSDNGSIIDFVQHRSGGSLGEVRKELRPWTGQGIQNRPPVTSYVKEVVPITPDRARVIGALSRMTSAGCHPYLEQVRGIPSSILESPRFAGKILKDERGNVVFPHRDRDGLCGYEIKNKGFTGFAPSGTKGLWFSAVNKGDSSLVITESAIDALSCACVHTDDNTRCYASTGGSMNPTQPALVRSAIGKMPLEGEIIIATDADAGGDKLAATIAALAKAECRTVTRARPPEGKDWNNALTALHADPLPYPQPQ